MRKLTGPNDGRRKLEGQIIDAEWEEVEDEPPSKSISLKQRLKNIAMGAGVIVVVLLVIGFGNAQPGGSGTQAASANASGASADQQATDASASPSPDASQAAFQPSELCNDEQVVDAMINFRRKWLLNLLTQMVDDRIYSPPPDGNPIAQGVVRATISYPKGARFSGYQETGGSVADNAFVVRCRGELEIRDAMMLPNGTWTPGYLTVPDAEFDVHAGKDGFAIALPHMDDDAASAVMHISGVSVPLSRMRAVVAGQ